MICLYIWGGRGKKFEVKSGKQPENNARKCLTAGNVVGNASHLLSRRNSLMRDYLREDFFFSDMRQKLEMGNLGQKRPHFNKCLFCSEIYIHAYGK